MKQDDKVKAVKELLENDPTKITNFLLSYSVKREGKDDLVYSVMQGRPDKVMMIMAGQLRQLYEVAVSRKQIKEMTYKEFLDFFYRATLASALAHKQIEPDVKVEVVPTTEAKKNPYK